MQNCGISVVIAPGDANAVIVREAVQIRDTGQLTEIIGEDVDLLILTIALADPQQDIIFIKPGRGNVQKKIFSSKENVEYRNVALFPHAFAGCDTTSSFFGHGKVTSWNALYKSSAIADIVTVFNNPFSSTENIAAAGESSIKILYGTDDNISLPALRYKKFSELGGRRKVDLRLLPPTNGAAEQHYA